MKTSTKLLFFSCGLILTCNIVQGMEIIKPPKKQPLSEQEILRMEIIRNETNEATYRRELRETILDLCGGITKFYRWAFNPLALKIYNDDLVVMFYDLILQMRLIAYTEYKNPIFQNCLFFHNDFNWHLDVDLSDESLQEFVGSHQTLELVNETLIRLFTLAQYLTSIRAKTNAHILSNVIDKGLGLIMNVSMMLNQYSDGCFIKRYLAIFTGQVFVTEDQDVF